MTENSPRALIHYEANGTLPISAKYTKYGNVEDDPLTKSLLSLPSPNCSEFELVTFAIGGSNISLNPKGNEEGDSKSETTEENPKNSAENLDVTGNYNPISSIYPKTFKDSGTQYEIMDQTVPEVVSDQANESDENRILIIDEIESLNSQEDNNQGDEDKETTTDCGEDEIDNKGEKKTEFNECIVSCLACCIPICDCTIQ